MLFLIPVEFEALALFLLLSLLSLNMLITF